MAVQHNQAHLIIQEQAVAVLVLSVEIPIAAL
jgi:hypothetical protein